MVLTCKHLLNSILFATHRSHGSPITTRAEFVLRVGLCERDTLNDTCCHFQKWPLQLILEYDGLKDL